MPIFFGKKAEALTVLVKINKRVDALRMELKCGNLPAPAIEHLRVYGKEYLRFLDEALERASLNQEIIVAERKSLHPDRRCQIGELISKNELETHLGLLAAMGMSFSDPNIPHSDEYAIVTFKQGVFGEEVRPLLKSYGYRPATLRELLGWTAEDCQLPQRYPYVLALGSVADTPEGQKVPFLTPFFARISMHGTDSNQYLHPGKYYLAVAKAT